MQNAMSPRTDKGSGTEIGHEDLARSLTLVRASAMNVLRLQLAMGRDDRRTVLQTIDELVALDNELRDFVGEIPGSDAVDVGRLQSAVDEQRALIAREKLQMVAGISRRGPPGRESDAAALPTVTETAALAEVEQEAEPVGNYPVPDEAGNGFAALVMTALLLLFAATLFIFATDQGRSLAVRILQWSGA